MKTNLNWFIGQLNLKNIGFLLLASLLVITGCKKKDISNDSNGSFTYSDPLCFTAVEDSATIGMKRIGYVELNPIPNIEYSYDKVVWRTFTAESTVITLENTGDKVYFRGNNPLGLNANLEENNSFIKFETNEKKTAVSGNLMSLIDPTCRVKKVPDYCFYLLFNGANITTPPELSATILGKHCYGGLFSCCTYLETAPELPATKMAEGCYGSMFLYCTNLKTPPILPATILAYGCYNSMFDSSGILEAPELPATTLADGCYANMFYYCKYLTTAPELPATTLAPSCYSSMFESCYNLTAAPELPATTLANYCYQYMFNGCDGLTTTPELPATTLTDYCYHEMFGGCLNLTTVSELPATTLAKNCYEKMFFSCENLTTAPAILPATILAEHCYDNMFCHCIKLETAPELPATALVDHCYFMMFNYCENLNSIKVRLTEWGDDYDTFLWLADVSSNGTFYCPTSLPLEYGIDRIPYGWTIVPLY